jgi:mannose-1-phosphate guanylyltransferase
MGFETSASGAGPAGGSPVTAFVLGAGLGTRLKALTRRLPKPLIPVANRPLITYAMDHLMGAGVRRFVVNTHWLAGEYGRAFPGGSYRGCPVLFREEQPEVLETAGGLKNAEDLFCGEAVVVYNGDILSDLPLGKVLSEHRASGNEVTLVLRSKDGPLQVAWDAKTGRVEDIGRRIHPEGRSDYLFTGIYVVEPGFLARIPPGRKLGVVPVFTEMILSGARLGGVVVDEGGWWDLGTREQYLAVHELRASEAPWIDPEAEVDASAVLSGGTAVGRGARVGARSRLENCILWPGARVEPGSVLRRCIVAGADPVSGEHEGVDF